MSAYVKLGFKKLNNHSAYYPHFGYSYVVEKLVRYIISRENFILVFLAM
jgi:hypothetical protein